MLNKISRYLFILALFALMAAPIAAQEEDELRVEEQIAQALADCESDTKLTIAISLADLTFPFFVHMRNQLVELADEIGGIDIIELDGQSSASKQTADIEAAITRGVDAIIISPVDVSAVSPALQEAIDAGIIVLTIDRSVEGVDGLLAHVGADNVLGGEAQGNWILENFPDGATVFNLQGQPGASAAIDRNQGLHNVLDEVSDNYPIVFEQTANFRRDQGLSVTEAGLAGLSEPPVVIVAANDDMALGAAEALSGLGLTGEIAVLGFDALPEALVAIRNGLLTGTVEQFPGRQSRTALALAVMEARGCDYEAEDVVFLTPILVDGNNFDVAERLGEIEEEEE